MIEIIDIKDAEITSISGETFLLSNSQLDYLHIGIEVNGYAKSMLIKGEKFQRVLELIKELINEENY
jgi:hypothetical protein